MGDLNQWDDGTKIYNEIYYMTNSFITLDESTQRIFVFTPNCNELWRVDLNSHSTKVLSTSIYCKKAICVNSSLHLIGVDLDQSNHNKHIENDHYFFFNTTNNSA